MTGLSSNLLPPGFAGINGCQDSSVSTYDPTLLSSFCEVYGHQADFWSANILLRGPMFASVTSCQDSPCAADRPSSLAGLVAMDTIQRAADTAILLDPGITSICGRQNGPAVTNGQAAQAVLSKRDGS